MNSTVETLEVDLGVGTLCTLVLLNGASSYMGLSAASSSNGGSSAANFEIELSFLRKSSAVIRSVGLIFSVFSIKSRSTDRLELTSLSRGCLRSFCIQVTTSSLILGP
jgi:hypothetical protein